MKELFFLRTQSPLNVKNIFFFNKEDKEILR
jgi:hypothetical protein